MGEVGEERTKILAENQEMLYKIGELEEKIKREFLIREQHLVAREDE